MSWQNGISGLLSEKFNKKVFINGNRYVGGGSINITRQIFTNVGEFFVKINSAERFPRMFEKEAKGLSVLRNASVIDIPEVVGYGENDADAYLVLNFIESGMEKTGFWENFGRKIALLHKNSDKFFGLDHDNFIGSLPQSNKQHKDWETFFIKERLLPQIEMARRAGFVDSKFDKLFNGFFKKLPEIFPKEQPALLHGDLWSGNFMINAKGKPVIIDPAVYYGNREMDLGMSKLFGGFDSAFYAAYHEQYPLEHGWQQRLDFCNLYPLMVHVNLFGGGYAGSVLQILKKFY